MLIIRFVEITTLVNSCSFEHDDIVTRFKVNLQSIQTLKLLLKFIECIEELAPGYCGLVQARG